MTGWRANAADRLLVAAAVAVTAVSASFWLGMFVGAAALTAMIRREVRRDIAAGLYPR